MPAHAAAFLGCHSETYGFTHASPIFLCNPDFWQGSAFLLPLWVCWVGWCPLRPPLSGACTCCHPHKWVISSVSPKRTVSHAQVGSLAREGVSRVSLPRLAVAEPCDGEQLPALLSGLENVRCDTAAAVEGQADKVGAGEGLERGEGMPTNPFLSMGRDLGESSRMPGAQPCPPPAPCPVSPRVPQGLSAFPSSVKNHVGWVDASFSPRQPGTGVCQQRGLAESAPWETWRLCLGTLLGTGTQPCGCSGPAWPQEQGPCPGVLVTAGRAWAQSCATSHPTNSHPGKGSAASCLFGCCTMRVELQGAPGCLALHLRGQV